MLSRSESGVPPDIIQPFKVGSWMLLIVPLMMVGFLIADIVWLIKSKKTVTYDFANQVVPVAKRRYSELFEFIKAHPLPPHRITNEFLAFAIAFGLDDSWQKDFGLGEELKIEGSTV